MQHSIINRQTYLKDLIEYVRQYISQEIQGARTSLQIQDLETLFCQPFSDLIKLDFEKDVQIPQIRLCLEVLQNHLGNRPLNDARLEQELQARELEYLESAYTLILIYLGISIEDLRNTDPEHREKVAERLGISINRLDLLPSSITNLSESFLENIFGLPDSNTIRLDAIDPDFLTWRDEYIALKANERFGSPASDQKTAWIQGQEQQAITDLSSALEKTEAVVLPQLRAALVDATGENARNLSQKLLIDCESDVHIQSSRIWQATLTIQQLFKSLRTGLLKDTHPDLTLDIEDFEENWGWMESYKKWQAAIEVFLYPENSIMLSSSFLQDSSILYKELVHKLKRKRRVNREIANHTLREYERHFKNKADLKVEASCQTQTPRNDENNFYDNLLYLFGRSDALYWASYRYSHLNSEWQEIPGFEDFMPSKIIGAIPFKNNESQRKIYLFVKGNFKRTQVPPVDTNQFLYPSESLVFTTYDLHTLEWSGKIERLGMSLGSLDMVVEQRLDENLAPHFIWKNNQRIHSRHFDSSGKGWAEDSSWNRLDQGIHITELHALTRVGSRYYLFTKTDEEFSENYLRIYSYRVQGDRFERKTDMGYGNYTGITIYKSSLYYFFSEQNSSKYRKITFSGSTVRLGTEQNNPVNMSQIAFYAGKSFEGRILAREGFRIAYKSDMRQVHAFIRPNSRGNLIFEEETQSLPSQVSWTDFIARFKSFKL